MANKDFEASTADFEAILELSAAPTGARTKALFSVPEPMVAHRSRAAVVQALKRAFPEGDRQCDDYGGTPHDLLAMVLRRGTTEWEG
ncbi:MAG: hypothetical protein ACI8W7_000927 [Gammaproteobacteria bacterium]|jgi:hypothetical protein